MSIMLENLSDFDLDISMSHNVKCDRSLDYMVS